MPYALSPMPSLHELVHNSNQIAIPLLLISFTTIPVASAHTVKIAEDIGGILHIEPNDNPHAGKPAQTWFALTRKGGKVLPLKECNCQLAVYAEPHVPGEPALLEPALKPIQVERYQGIPGTEITFPKPGVYQLKLSGKPVTAGDFQPFELDFQVIVARGKSIVAPQAAANVTDISQQQTTTISLLQSIIIFAIILSSIGILFSLTQALRR